ncbi:MAG: prepilin-type N-terminal cleavage/methylation domain-containing protein [Actinomycetes bacterium]
MIGLMRRLQRDDGGFTLMEVVVAIMIAAVIFMALAAASISALRGSGVARQNNQSISLGNATLEAARTATYTGLAMATADLSGDSRVLSGNTLAVPDVGTENLYVLSTGTMSPHVTTVTRNGQTYTVSQYVTVPAGTALDGEGYPLVKRVTVFVTWTAYGSTRTRTYSTLIVPTKRGLPLPDYSMSLRTPSCYAWNTGDTQRPIFSVLLRNVGARDTFDLSLVSANDSPSNWTFYTTDPTLGGAVAATDTSGNGTVDSGNVDPYSTKEIWVRRNAVLSTGTTVNLQVRAQSAAQPSATTAVVTLPAAGSSPSTLSTTSVSGNVVTCAGAVTATPTPTPTGSTTPTGPVADAVCPATPVAAAVTSSTGYAARAFGLNNGDTTIDGTTQATGRNTAKLGAGTDKTNTLTQDTCMPQTGSPDFSTNYTTTGYTAGRVLVAGGVGTTADTADKQVEWVISPTTAFRVGVTTHYLSVMVQCTATSPSTATLAASLWSTKNNGYASQLSSSTGNTATVSCATAGTWQRVNVPIPVTTASGLMPGTGGVVGMAVRLWEPGTGPSLRLGYDLMAGDVATAKSFLTLQTRSS